MMPFQSMHRQGRLLRALRRYGFSGVLRSACWMAMNHPIFGQKHRLRVAVLRGMARFFQIAGIQRLATRVNGVKIFFDPRDSWSLRAYFFSPTYDWEEISSVLRTVPKGYLFIDVGANFGAWSFTLAPHFERVIAIEPERRCLDCCAATALALGFKNVAFVPAALTDRDGAGRLHPLEACLGDGRIYDAGDPGRGEGAPIRLTTFETLVREYQIDTRLLFVKLDVQGVEPQVLLGMRKVLERSQDVILWTEMTDSTLSSAGSSLEAYRALLQEIGFVPVDLSDGLRETNPEAVVAVLRIQKNFCWRLKNGAGWETPTQWSADEARTSISPRV